MQDILPSNLRKNFSYLALLAIQHDRLAFQNSFSVWTTYEIDPYHVYVLLTHSVSEAAKTFGKSQLAIPCISSHVYDILCRETFGAGCNSRPAVRCIFDKTRQARESHRASFMSDDGTDSVRSRSRRYSPDGRRFGIHADS